VTVAMRDRILFTTGWLAALGFAVGVWAFVGWGLERIAR
jgi:hypothetical protein